MVNEKKLRENLSKLSQEELIEFAVNAEMDRDRMLEHLKSLRNKTFKPSSESSDQLSLELFNEVEDTIDNSTEDDLKEVITYERSKNKKEKKKADFSNLKVKVIHHELQDKTCPECGAKMKELKSEITEVLKYIPEEYYIERHITHVYVCNECSIEEDALVSTKAPGAPKKLIDGSMASSSVISGIAVNKFVQGRPLYRQEAELFRKGIPFTRQNMSNWLMKAEQNYLRPVFERMHSDLKKLKTVHCDETTLVVLEEKAKEDKDKSYMWLAMSGKKEQKQIALYFHHDRKYEHVDEILGDDFSGYVHSDGYGAYLNKGYTSVVCYAHIRRKFMDYYKINSDVVKEYEKIKNPEERTAFLAERPSFCNAVKAIAYIDRLFAIERKGYAQEERVKLALPIVREFTKFIESLKGKYPPKTKMATAIEYTLDLKPCLENYLLDEGLEISNNRAERAIKDFVIARKNFLFSNTRSGAQCSAVYCSLIESAKLNQLDPYKYLVYVLDTLNEKGVTDEVIESVLPYSETLPNDIKSKGRPAK
ncbi:MAG: IS66 family transposase [Bacteroidales bacterium]|nr:IS66 family transposase [Bacteroidales bacterium]